MKTTVFKVISFIMSKKCQELISGLLWIGSERKGSNPKVWGGVWRSVAVC